MPPQENDVGTAVLFRFYLQTEDKWISLSISTVGLVPQNIADLWKTKVAGFKVSIIYSGNDLTLY